MLEAIPVGFFSGNFRFEENGVLMGELDISMWRHRAQLELEDGTYSLYRTGVATGDFVIERDGTIFGRAAKTSFSRPDFDVEIGKRALTLRRPSIWTRGYALFESGKQVGTVAPTSFFSRRAIIDLPSKWPVRDRAFFFWLCLIMWKRQSQAAS